MAPAATYFILFITIFNIVCLHDSKVESVRTKKKIYLDLQTQNACFRVLNATHQVGCSSKPGGSVGILHYLEGPDDYKWVLHDAPHTPFTVLIKSIDFNKENVDKMVNSGRVSGMLIVNVLNDTNLTPIPPMGFSADKSCPNDNYGVYNNDSTYSHCKKVTWNKPGEGLYFHDYHDFPMFSISNISDFNILVDECYRKFNQPENGVAKTYPLCAVELGDGMDAAKDSQTCLRRSNLVTNLNPTKFCDALGDQNIVSTMKVVLQNETRPEKSVIIAATRMDSFSMFGYEYQNSDTTVTGIVALLAAAEALKQMKSDFLSAPNDLMFTFFQGEAFDYIGSSRMVYEMEKNTFPYKVEDNKIYPHPINLSHISHFVELTQLGFRDEGNLWIHSDPISKDKKPIAEEVEKMVGSFKDIGQNAGVSFAETVSDQPLPPASAQRFLRKTAIPTIVVSDHKNEFKNKYYNSRFDLPSFINASYPENLTEEEKYDYVTDQAKSLTKVSTALARFLYTLTTGTNMTSDLENKIQANEKEIAHLLYCFLESPVCELFKQSVSPEDSDNLASAKKPFPFYVSVNYQTNQITLLAHAILSQYLGEKLSDIKSENDCNQPADDKSYKYIWIQGSVSPESKKREGWCIKSTAIMTKAESPAFVIDNYDWLSGEYSTWTESVWKTLKVRAFLIPSESQETLTLSIGVIITLLSMIFVYFFNSKASLLFMDPIPTRYY